MVRKKKNSRQKKKNQKDYIITKHTKPKKRNYNEMLEDNKNISTNIKDEKDEKNLNLNRDTSAQPSQTNNNSNNNNRKHDIFYNTINIDKTYMPNEELINNNENNRNLNNIVYEYFVKFYKENTNRNLLKTLKVNEDALLIQKIYGDGNCLFRSISHFITGSEEYHLFIRNLLYHYIIENFDSICAEFPYVYYEGNTIDIDEYIPLIKNSGTFGGELECNLLKNIKI